MFLGFTAGNFSMFLNICLLQVCGMCGNYNHDGSDDNLMPNNKPAKDAIELGNSWKSEGDSDPGSVTDDMSPCRTLTSVTS